MRTDINVNVDNYKNYNKIVTNLGLDVENILVFDRNEKYEFFYYGACDGPILGHQQLNAGRIMVKDMKEFWLENLKTKSIFRR